jgi:hypothetical protein
MMGGSDMRSRLIGWLVALYPADWRARYGEEYLAVLEQMRLTPRVVADHIRAAVAVQLDPGRDTAGARAVADRLRSSELTVLMSWLALVVGGLAYQRMIDDAALAGAGDAHDAIRIGLVLVVAGALLSLAAVMVGSLPALLAIVRTAIAGRRPGLLGLLAVPPLLLVGFLALTVRLASGGAGSGAEHAQVALFAAWGASFVAALAAGAAAVSLAAARASVPAACFRFAIRPAYALTAAMALVSAGALVWGAALATFAPSLFWGDQGLVASSTALSWLGVMALMSGATVIAVRSALRIHRLAIPPAA